MHTVIVRVRIQETKIKSVHFHHCHEVNISGIQDPSRENLKIREDGLGGVYVEGLSEHVALNTDGVISLLRKGAHLRTTATTKMNKVGLQTIFPFFAKNEVAKSN